VQQLLLRVVSTPSTGTGPVRSAPVDVAVRLDDEHRVADLVTALAAHVGVSATALTVVRTGAVPHPDAAVSSVDLLSGDEVALGARTCARVDVPYRALALDITAGPETGRSFLLDSGTITIGRSTTADVTLADPTVSRHHARLTVGVGEELTIDAVAGAGNGVTVDGDAIVPGRPTSFRIGSSLAFGGTRAVVRRFERRAREHTDRLGQVDFHRTPHRPSVLAVPVLAPIGPIPSRPDARRLQAVALLAPLAIGVAMYLMTEQLPFLLFTLVSPLVAVATAIDDRRNGRRTARQRLAEFRAMVAERRAELAQWADAEVHARRGAAPDVAELVRRAELRTVDLWARGRSSPDFLRLRLGLGGDAAGFSIELAAGGDDDLRAEARATLHGVDRLTDVPVVVDLAEHVLAVHGPPDLVDGVAASLLVQITTLHSPDDVVVAAAVDRRRGLDWLKWLPHVRSVTSPLPGAHLAADTHGADALVGRLVQLAERRAAERIGAFTAGRSARWRWVIAVLDAGIRPDPAATSRLLALAPGAGISVIWLADDAGAVPRHTSRVLEVGHGAGARLVGRLWATDPAVPEREVDVEHVRRDIATTAARALAPVRDASTGSSATSIPGLVPLFDTLGVPSPDRIADAWRRRDRHHLRFPIGITADGPLELDLVGDGPHTLIGGTSGAGKSELLQAMVAALATRHPPTRLNFLFVDYKGGAASQVFERLPHTVGHVTNLSADLAVRALTSLRAELEHRMTIMEGRAKDLAELIDREPAAAPASLVIVVDEFASLVKEIPEFVAGIVDIAQRGRSLGIHLVLATQRPTGAVDENILANTNLRIGLRMLDRSESSAVIGSTDAANIPVPLRGRGFVRLGPRSLIEFQCAFGGAAVVATDGRNPVRVSNFDLADDIWCRIPPVGHGAASHARDDRRYPTPTVGAGTQLGAVLDAIVAADRRLGLPAPRRPWREVLPAVVTLDDLLGAPEADGVRAHPGRMLPVGLLDAPDTQEQGPLIVDLEQTGTLAVFGSGGAGKTTLLRTLATSVERCDAGAVVVFDFASRGLSALRSLRSVVDVATADDLEAVTRHLVVLDLELDRRRRLLAACGAEHLTAHVRAGGERLERILVLIDGFGALVDTLFDPVGTGFGAPEAPGAAAWHEIVRRLVVDGRNVGIHVVLTTDRCGSIPSRIQSAIGARLVLRHADPQSYVELGIAGDRAAAIGAVPGRALVDGRSVVQLAVVSADPAARAQLAAVDELAVSVVRRTATVLASRALPDVLDELPRTAVSAIVPADVVAGPECRRGGVVDVRGARPDHRGRRPADSVRSASSISRLPIGVADITGEQVVLDIEWSHAAIVGPPRSGRSTVLAAVLDGLADTEHRQRVHVVAPVSSPLARDHPSPRSAFGRGDEVGALLARLADRARAATSHEPIVLVVDDIDAFDDLVLSPLWERLLESDAVRLVAAVETRSMSGYTTNPAIAELRRARRMLVLQPDDPTEFLQLTGLRLALRPGIRLVPGRGVLVAERRPTVVQVRAPRPAPSGVRRSDDALGVAFS
jgi:S-DNA-T family DNA segregation ATPase FtsK/SpoIIIE